MKYKASSDGLVPLPQASGSALLEVAPSPCDPHATLAVLGGVYWALDARLATLDNVLTSPATGHAAVSVEHSCPAVERNVVNEKWCVERPTCAPARFSGVPFELNETSIRAFYSLAGRVVYALDGLRLEDTYRSSPCSSAESRWRISRGACAAETPLGPGTREAIASALRSSNDPNPLLRDVTVGSDGCDADDEEAAIAARVSSKDTGSP